MANVAMLDDISKWLLERVQEIEARHTDPADPGAEDARQLASSLRYAMGGAQEVARLGQPHMAEVLFKWAAKPFSEYEGYDASWAP